MICVYFHVFAPDLTVLPIVRDTMNKLLFSSLLLHAEVRCCVTSKGNAQALGAAVALLQSYPNTVVLATSLTDTTHERYTIERMLLHTQPNDVVLYLHAKGITRTSHKDYHHVLNWIDRLHYHLIYRWRECIDLLAHYDMVGCDHLPKAGMPEHFSGNFWWATGKHIISLRQFPIADTYDGPEVFVWSGSPRWISMFDANICPYYVSIPPKDFIKGGTASEIQTPL